MALDCGHLVDKAMCAQVGICTAGNKSNILVVCPNLHRMLEATKGEGGDAPTVYIKGISIDRNDRVVDTSGKTQFRVNVRIVFRDQDTYVVSKIELKYDTVKEGYGEFRS